MSKKHDTCRFNCKIKVRIPSSRMWEIVSDTTLINEIIGLSRYSVVRPEESYNAFTLGAAFTNDKHKREQWIETYPEWVEGQWLKYERHYLKGKYKYLSVQIVVTESTAGSFVEFSFAITPSGIINVLILRSRISANIIKRITSFFERLNETPLNHDKMLPTIQNTMVMLPATSVDTLQECCNDMLEEGFDHVSVDAIYELLTYGTASESEVIRPRKLSFMLKVPEPEITTICIAFERMEILECRYLIRCPRCRNVCAEKGFLEKIYEKTVCLQCIMEFTTDLAWNVEVIFSPRKEIRQFDKNTSYALSGPMSARHVKVQQILSPRERRSINYDLQPGSYRIRSDRNYHNDVTFMHHGDKGAPTIIIKPGGYITLGETCLPGVLILENNDIEPHLIIVDNNEWGSDVLTAAEFCVLQSFQDYHKFDAPTFQGGIRAGRPTIVAVTIAPPELVFSQFGDEEGLNRFNRIIELIKERSQLWNGGVFRSEGSLILAAFRQPRDALMFAGDIQKIGYMMFSEDDFDDIDEDMFKQFEENKSGEGAKIGINIGDTLASYGASGFEFGGTSVAIAECLCKIANPGEIITPAHMINELDFLDTNYVSSLKIEEMVLANSEKISFLRLT